MSTSIFNNNNSPVMQNSLRVQQQDSPSSGSEPQRCCVVCERTSPKTIFSCRYKVHERNVDILQKFFERNDLRFGELCDRCYRLWYKHKRTKTTPAASKDGSNNNSSKGEKVQQANTVNHQQHGSVINSHEGFHGNAPSSDEEQQEEEEEEQQQQLAASWSSPGNNSINQRLQQKSRTSNIGSIFQKHQQQLQQVSPSASRIEKYQKADFSHCLRALALLAKPARKSRRKNTPVRSAPRADLHQELFYGHGSTSVSLARIVLMKDLLLLEEESTLAEASHSLAQEAAAAAAAAAYNDNVVMEDQHHQSSSGDEEEEEEEEEMEKEEPAIENNNFAQVLQSASVAV